MIMMMHTAAKIRLHCTGAKWDPQRKLRSTIWRPATSMVLTVAGQSQWPPPQHCRRYISHGSAKLIDFETEDSWGLGASKVRITHRLDACNSSVFVTIIPKLVPIPILSLALRHHPTQALNGLQLLVQDQVFLATLLISRNMTT